MKLKFRHKDKILQILLLLLCSEVRCLENGGNSDQVVHFGRLLFSSTRPRPENEGVDSAEFVKDTSEFQSDQPESTVWSSHAFLRLQRLSPLVLCGNDSMTLNVQGSRIPHFFTESGEGQSVPLDRLPTHCGLTVKRARRDVSLVAKYNGCNVAHQGNTYVLPLRLWGTQVKMACPVVASCPTVKCSNSAMVINVDSTDGVKLRVNDVWLSLSHVLSICGASFEAAGSGGTLTVPYVSSCMRTKGAKILLSMLYVNEELSVSCPVQPSTDHLPAQDAVFPFGQAPAFPPGQGLAPAFPPGQGLAPAFPPGQGPAPAFPPGQGPPFPPGQGPAPAFPPGQGPPFPPGQGPAPAFLPGQGPPFPPGQGPAPAFTPGQGLLSPVPTTVAPLPVRDSVILPGQGPLFPFVQGPLFPFPPGQAPAFPPVQGPPYPFDQGPLFPFPPGQAPAFPPVQGAPFPVPTPNAPLLVKDPVILPGQGSPFSFGQGPLFPFPPGQGPPFPGPTSTAPLPVRDPVILPGQGPPPPFLPGQAPVKPPRLDTPFPFPHGPFFPHDQVPFTASLPGVKFPKVPMDYLHIYGYPMPYPYGHPWISPGHHKYFTTASTTATPAPVSSDQSLQPVPWLPSMYNPFVPMHLPGLYALGKNHHKVPKQSNSYWPVWQSPLGHKFMDGSPQNLPPWMMTEAWKLPEHTSHQHSEESWSLGNN